MAEKKQKTEGPGIEESFRLLEKIIEKMENEETGLEESFRLYEEGIGLLKNTEASISRVEEKLKILSQREEEA